MDERIFGGNIAGGLVVPSGRVVYDGKRMRKAITRRTIDHCASIMRWIEDRALGGGRSLRLRPYASLQPNPANIINVFSSPFVRIFLCISISLSWRGMN